jgi:tRNA(Ile)-lysidine synthase
MGDVPGALPPGRSRDELVAEVRSRLSHLPAGAPVVVACSAGPDSTALAFLTSEARPDLEPTLVHVRHGLRDDTLDRTTVEQHASWLGVKWAARDVEVVSDGHGVEAAARDARYAALRRVADEVRAGGILVGHTADDQAETVLLRLARGTGLDGLRAMAPVSGDLIRPLLRIRRVDLRRFVALEGLPVVHDPGNLDPAIRRSLVRTEVVPALERLAPDPVGALTRLADLARDDVAALDAAAEDLRRTIRRTGPVTSLPVGPFSRAQPSLASRVVREVLTGLVGTPPSAEIVTRVLTTPAGSGASLPGGLQLSVGGAWRAIAPRQLPTAEDRHLSIPGETIWAPAGVRLRSRLAPEQDGGAETRAVVGPRAVEQLGLGLAGDRPPRHPRIATRIVPPGANAGRMWLPLPADAPPLTVRARRPGDRIRTTGGTRRVAEVLSAAAVPRPVRAVWPVVADGSTVLWVPGYAADQDLLDAGRAAPAVLLVLGPAARGRPW